MKNKINFNFKSNWSLFSKWFDNRKNKGVITDWNDQFKMIQTLFEKSAPKIINWSRIYKDQSLWFDTVKVKKGQVLWTEQKRQIETLLLNQVSELNQNVWTVVFKDLQGKPSALAGTFTHNEALKMKRVLAGDDNGEGGKDNVSDAVVVNLNSLF